MGGSPNPRGVDLRYENVRLVITDDRVTLVFHVEHSDTLTYHYDQKTGLQLLPKN